MRWKGKVIGVLLGYFLGGGIGALLGAVFGHAYDSGMLGQIPGMGGADLAARIQRTFFRATFQVMGSVCKADGRVTEAEIQVAEQIMRQMSLSAEQRRQAIEYFNQGKQPGFDLDAVIDEFRRTCRWQPNLFRFFLEVQLQAAFADGKTEPQERDLLLRIAKRLGLSARDYARLESLLRGERHRRDAARSSGEALEAAYELLGVDRNATEAEIKKAYRRLMSRHHPDKLVAKGLPQEMMEMAKRKTQEIRAAYDTVRDSRGMP